MVKSTLKSVVVTELWPEEDCKSPECAWRLITWDGEYAPEYELYRTKFEWHDDGDCESGPRMSCIPGPWEMVSGGFGFPKSIEEEIEHFEYMEPQNFCDDQEVPF